MSRTSDSHSFYDLKADSARQYWQRVLSIDHGDAIIRADHSAKASGSIERSLTMKISGATIERLTKLTGGSPFLSYVTLLTALKTCLYRFSRSEVTVVGAPLRAKAGIPGGFSQPLVIVDEIDSGMSFRTLLSNVKETVAEAYQYQDYPPGDLINESAGGENRRAQPQVLLAVKEFHGDRSSPEGNIVFRFEKREAEMPGTVDFDPRQFGADLIQRLIDDFLDILSRALEDPAVSIGELSSLRPNERRQIVQEWNCTSRPFPESCGIHELFIRQVKAAPEAVAIVGDGHHLTYGELNRSANQLAHHLMVKGLEPEGRVALCFERNPWMVIGALGVLKAGGVYLPLDVSYPQDRLAYMLNDAQAEILITQQPLLEHLPLTAAQVICLDAEWKKIGEEWTGEPESRVESGNAAYLIYTSGSTGRPKGVMIEHKGLCNLVEAQKEAFEIGHPDRSGEQSHVLQFASFSFDASVSEIFSTLAGGGSLHLHPQDRLMPGTDLVRALTEDQITIATLPPTVLAMLEEEELSQLQTVIAAGEACNTEIVERWAHGRRFLNAYGPTESTVCASIEVCETGTGRKPTIGRPLANTRLYILDRELAPVPVGVQGELYVAGVGLARGYWSRPELTAERFIPDLFGDPGGERLYRTGDLVRYLPDGRIEFIGRADTQVKIRGYRIELGEIEAILNEHRSVSQSAVVMSEEEGGDRRIIGYVVGETDATADELKRHVRERLPEYMVPGLIRLLKEMPVTANGKIDRKRLPFAPLRNDADHWMEPEETGARTPIEEILMGIFEEVLKVSGVGRDDNFFGIGGHSLLATQVVSRVRTAFGLEIGVKSLFERATARELARKIEALMSGGRSMEAPPLVRASRQAVLPLSFAQQRLWFLDQLMPNNPFYNCLGAVRLEGRLGIAVLERSINEVVRRHEVLRTRIQIIDDEPAQMIEDWSPRSLERVDLSHLDPERRDAAIHEIMREEAGTGFDLSRGPLLKIKTLKLGEEEQVVLLTMHHIVSDGWSMGILIREVGALYRAYSAGEESPLPELEIQYADYAVWQRNWLRGEALDRQLRYWEEQLAGVVPLELPTDYPHPATASYRGANLSFELSETLTQGLHELSRREGGTMFMTLLAAFQTLLMRYSGQEEITVGSPIANRTRAETERLIGFFVNTLVLRTRVERNLSFRELLRRVREVCLGAYAHQDLPFEQLVGDLQPERDLSRQPLFQVMLILQNAPSESLELPGLRMSKLEVPVETSKFDLLLATAESKGRLVGSINYSSDLFEAATIERLIEHLRIVLEKAVADPGGQVSMIEYLTDRERQQILEDWNETRVDYPSEQCLHELFEQQVERSPDAVAMVFDGVCLSYRELNRQANQLAHHLQGLGSGPEKLIGICVERSVEMIVGLIGILKSGAAYLPLDPAYPAERLHLMLRDAEPLAILAQERLLGVLPEFEGVTVCLDRDWPLIAERSDRNLPLQMASGNPAYVIYTSGSTGRPKGVLVPHRQVINFFIAMNADLEPDPEAAWLAVTSISFDISVLELLWTLARGFRFVVQGEKRGIQGEDFSVGAQITRHQISHRQCTPSMAKLLSLEPEWPAHFSSLRKIMIGGEAFPSGLAEQLKPLATAEIRNLYGPTETTVWSATYWLRGDENRIPIGRPIANTRIYILDQAWQSVPVGVPGELYIGGDGVVRGYLRQPELTAERFLPDPFGAAPGARFYRTGDLARYLDDGNIEFLGRVDHQVKMRGFRIELGEIEQVLTQHPAIGQSVVTLRDDHSSDQRLVAYLVRDRKESGPGRSRQIGESDAQQLSQWQTVFNQTYDSLTPPQDHEFNLAGWNSSYTGKPIAGEAMREWLDDIIERILSFQPQNVLEIGCGTGLILFRIAPHCKRYWATDFSQQAVADLDRQCSAKPDLSSVTVRQRAAENFEDVEPKSFDTIILNSVAQYFPGLDYLIDVLGKAVGSLKSGGRMIVGDVRSLPLLKTFHTTVQLFQAPSTLPVAELTARTQRRLGEEKELVIDPMLFIALKQHLPRIKQVEIRLKGGREHNELTKYRYDVILHVSDEELPAIECSWLDWQADSLSLPAVRQLLSSERPEILAIGRVPNARLAAEQALLKALAGGGGQVGDLQTRLESAEGIEPDDLTELGRGQNYEVRIYWSGPGHDDCFDLLFFRPGAEAGRMISPAIKPSYPETVAGRDFWNRYVNDPLQAELSASLITELREHVKLKLPEYMVPAAFVLMDELPLTPNGKVDRRALPAPEAKTAQERESQAAPRTPVEELLAGIFEEVLNLGRVGRNDNFFELGGHSLLATKIVSRVREAFGAEIGVRDIFEETTVTGLARRIEVAMKAGEGPEAPPLAKAARTGRPPLSFAQQRLWFLDQLLPNDPLYNMPGAIRLEGRLDIEALERGVNEIVRRHEVLRTRIEMEEGEPVQAIDPWEYRKLEMLDLTGLTRDESAEMAGKVANQEAETGFDLSRGPLLRVKILKLGAEEHVALFTMHHIVSDGWSMGILVREIGELYRAYSVGAEPRLDELPIQYADFAVWQRRWLQGESLEHQLAYWVQHLGGEPPRLELPTDKPRPDGPAQRGAQQSRLLPVTLSDSLKALSLKQSCTLFMTLLAAFKTLLFYLTGQTEITVGTDIANRNRAETEQLIGFFVNQLVLRADLSPALAFEELLRKVREITLGAYAHQDLPFEKLVEAIKPNRDQNRTPLFQVKMVLQNASAEKLDLPGLTISPLKATASPAKFDLLLNLNDLERGLNLSLQYNADLFEDRTPARILDRFQTLLGLIVERPQSKLDELIELLRAEDRRERLESERELETVWLSKLKGVKRKAIGEAKAESK